MFNVAILNMPSFKNSMLKNIYSVAVVKSKLLKKYGFSFLVNELMSELKELESDDGMHLDIPDLPGGLRIRGTIAMLCADSKAAHEIGGFMSPSANRFCRFV